MPEAGPRRVGAALAGLGVLVTRPDGQSDRLVEAVREQGGDAFRLPAIQIAPVEDPAPARAILASVCPEELVIFTSANAVRYAAGLWPRDLCAVARIAAVGGATARALQAAGASGVLVPEGRFDSEGLLALDALHELRVRGRRVTVVCGEGGRGLLADELERRGAIVARAEVYRRRAPSPDAEALGSQRGRIQIAVVTSVEAVENLFEMHDVAGRAWLRGLVWVTVSDRVAAALRARGVAAAAAAAGSSLQGPILIAQQAGDEPLIEAIRRWRDAARGAAAGTRAVHGPPDGPGG